MRTIFLSGFLLISFCGWSQHSGFGKKKKKAPVYTTIHAETFAVGERIDLGEIAILPAMYHRDTLLIPDSLDRYRQFVQRNPHITFRLNFVWKNQGVKYPWRSDHAREKLLDYINEDGPDENGSYNDSTCYIYAYKHFFVKQGPMLRAELEVVKVEAMHVLPSNGQGSIGLPELDILYRNYNNRGELALNSTCSFIPLTASCLGLFCCNDSYSLSDKRLLVKNKSNLF